MHLSSKKNSGINTFSGPKTQQIKRELRDFMGQINRICWSFSIHDVLSFTFLYPKYPCRPWLQIKNTWFLDSLIMLFLGYRIFLQGPFGSVVMDSYPCATYVQTTISFLFCAVSLTPFSQTNTRKTINSKLCLSS